MRTKLISAPYTIWMTLFIIVPMGLVAFFAFTDKSGAFTLDNIARVGQYSNVFLRSIWLGARSRIPSPKRRRTARASSFCSSCCPCG
mgnify:CR=1 FL=1